MRSVLYIFFFLIFLLLILHLPSVQTWLTKRVVNQVTDAFNGSVTIEDTKLDIYHGITINGIALIGSETDTLLTLDNVGLTPRNTLLSLLTGELAINDLKMSGVHVYLNRKDGDNLFNWEKFIGDNDKSSDEKTSNQSFNLTFLRTKDFHLSYNDQVKGEHISASFKSFEVDINELDLTEGGKIDVSRILLENPIVKISNTRAPDENPKAETEVDSINIDSTSDALQVLVDNLAVINGSLSTTSSSSEDFSLIGLDLVLKEMEFNGLDSWSAIIESLSGQSNDDRIPHASVGLIERKNGAVTIRQGVINLNQSSVRFDGQIGEIPDLADLSQATLSLNVMPSVLYVEDLYSILPSLKKEFYGEPIAKKRLQVEGDVTLQNNSYKGDNISIWLNGLHHFEGDIAFEKANKIEESILTANVVNLYADVPDLASMSSRFKIPKEIVRLQTVDFSGSFDGFLNDFVANGLLDSPLGRANLDIKFDLSQEGASSVSYDGFLMLDSFDLKKMTLNEDFGLVTAQVNITDGIGRDLSSSSANIKAVIDRFEFKDFAYEGAVYEGNLSSKVIDGQFEIEDEELDFEFDGLVDFSDSLYVFDFNVLAKKINFCQLNLTDFPCQLAFSSDINLKGNSLNNLDGQAILNDVLLLHDTSELRIEKIDIRSIPGNVANSFYINSDFLDFDIEGRFNLLKVFQNTVDQVVANVEEHNVIWNYKLKGGQDVHQKYRFSLLLKESTPLFDFMGIDLVQTGYASIVGGQNGDHGMVDVKASIPYISYNGIASDSLAINITSRDRIAVASSRFWNLTRGDAILPELNIVAAINEGQADWSLKYFYDDYNKARVLAQSEVVDDGYFTVFKEDDVIIDSSRWSIQTDKGLGIYPGSIDIEEFSLSDGERYVSIKDISSKGLELSMNDFQLGFINSLINYDKTILSGSVESTLQMEDVFNNRSLEGFINVQDFKVNGDDFGTLQLQAKKASETENIIDIDLRIEKDTQNLYANGFANLDSSLIDVDINIEDYPMAFFEYIIEDGISETIGTTDIKAKLSGDLDDLKLAGKGLIKNAGVKVDFLGAFYRMEDQTVTLDERFIDFGGVELIDEMGNTAVIDGGLRHQILADIRADLSISSPRFIGLNTTIEDNPLYYGTGVGNIDISFKGPFDAIDIVVAAELQNLSHLYIPLSTTAYAYDESFIVFNSPEDTVVEKDGQSLAELLKDQGTDFEMSLTFTPEARVSIIYDESTSNVLEGTGTGNLQINVKRDGEFSAFGTYNVLSGQYLYTAYGLIAKPFVISNGGTVRWTGDPLNATLDVTAQYPSLRAPLENLLQEFETLPASELSARRDIDLKLILTGQLFNPNIDFDIEFPNLIGPVRTFAENKVRTLKATENGINNQVVGLMVFNNFLPDNNGLTAISASTVGQSGNNTITQYLTSQLSIFFSDYLSSKFSDDDFISAIDFEIGVAQNTSLLGEDATLFEGLLDVVPDEVQLNLRNHFKNDNFVLNLGGNYVRENSLATAKNYVTGDFSLDWFITEDRRLKLRFYANYDYDDALSTRRQRYGFGINFRREFGSISDIERVMDEIIEQIREQENTTTSIEK